MTSSEFAPRSLELARHRLAQIALAVGVVTVTFRPLTLIEVERARGTTAFLELGGLFLITLALDASLYLVARSRAVSDQQALDFALLYEVLRCGVFGVSLVRFEGLTGQEPSAVTFALIVLMFIPLVVPMRPWKALLVSVAAASLHPLFLVSISPVPVPSVTLVHSVLASGLAVAFAVLCGRVGYALTARAAGGATLGSYRLEELLGRDAWGELWRASHRLLARPAAVRMIPPKVVNRPEAAQARARFREEASIAASLTSPYTVTLYDYGISESGWTYRAMELLDGEPLGKWVTRDVSRSLPQLLTMAARICDSLTEAHEAGLVHGSLTPDHVYVCRVGGQSDFVKVAGFGRMRVAADAKGATGSGAWKAWPEFVAPESATDGHESMATDIYQFGRLLEFLLDILPEGDRAGFEPVRRLVERCVASDPAARFDSSRTMLDEVRRISGARSLAVPRVQSGKDDRRHPTPRRSGHRVKKLGRSDRALQLTVGVDRAQHGTLLSRDADSKDASPEVLDAARQRLAHVGIICATMGSIALVLVAVSALSLPDAGRLPVIVSFGLLGVALDVTLVVLSRARRLSTGAVLRAAVAYFVVRCWVFGFFAGATYSMFGLAAPRVTFAAIFMILLPAFVPLRPKQLIVPCLLVVLGQFVALLATSAPGRADWGHTATAVTFAVVSSVFVARIIHSLHKAASRRGSTYGAYRLKKRIGRGGMGEVWKADHELLARPAAVKLIRHGGGMSEEEVASRWQRFEKEAYATSLLTSPHTVTLYDYGVADDGTYYYVMELLQGETLRTLVERSGPLTAEQTIAIGQQVCDSLSEAHARGLVHRDLKPENLFLTRAGCDSSFLKVLDFGLVDFFRGTHRFQRSGAARTSVIGTPQYMSPEALFGRGSDERSDIYQIGCVLHFLLTGQPPFDETNLAALAWAHAEKRPPRASKRSPHVVPQALDSLIRRCLAKAPEARFGSATELSRALDDARPKPFEGQSRARRPQTVAFGDHNHV